MKTQTLTANQHYNGLNRRFDRRAARLIAAGFVYKQIEEYGIAVFTSAKQSEQRRRTIPACMLHNADNRTWIDYLARVVSRGM